MIWEITLEEMRETGSFGVNHWYRGTNYFCFLARFAQFDGMEPKKMQEKKHFFWVDLGRIDIASVAVMVFQTF